jgi:2-(1,2-epoxy-1,2-dihydrophenyl)acetyl-CoA isomerase
MEDLATVRFDREDATATLTMNRPERRNALSPQLDRDLRDAFDRLADTEDIRAVVLRGAGDGFCAGADLTVLQDDPTPEDLYDHLTERYLPLIQRIVTLPLPVLAAVHGTAAGAGMALALACDLRVMAENAQLMMAFSSIGFVPDSGASYLLARQVGYSRAFELAAEAEPLPARDCLDLGLANRLAPPDHLVESARSWAHQLAERPTRALARTKDALRYGMTHSLSETIAFEAGLQKEMVQTEDHKEGLEAFLEKRAPDFSGH